MIDYRYDEPVNTLHVMPEGVMTTEDAIGYFNEIKGRFKPGMHANEIVDFRTVDDIQFSYSGLTVMREVYKTLSQSGYIDRTTFVVNSDLGFGIARMILSTFEEINHHFEIQDESRGS